MLIAAVGVGDEKLHRRRTDAIHQHHVFLRAGIAGDDGAEYGHGHERDSAWDRNSGLLQWGMHDLILLSGKGCADAALQRGCRNSSGMPCSTLPWNSASNSCGLNTPA